MDKRLSLMWLGLACVVAVGLGAITHDLGKQDLVYKRKEKAEYNVEIYLLKQRIATLELKASTDHRAGIQTQARSVSELILRYKPKLNPSIIDRIDRAIMRYSEQYQLPPEIVVHLMKRESNFNTRAFSSVGAVGLMQIFPKWHKDKMEEMGITHEEVYDIDNNVRLGCWILRQYLDQTNSIDKALTKYVGGKHPTYVTDILSGYTNEMIARVE
jgi:soluble lytic murein transglycosylase-like protein